MIHHTPPDSLHSAAQSEETEEDLRKGMRDNKVPLFLSHRSSQGLGHLGELEEVIDRRREVVDFMTKDFPVTVDRSPSLFLCGNWSRVAALSANTVSSIRAMLQHEGSVFC